MELRLNNGVMLPNNSLFNHFNQLWNELERPRTAPQQHATTPATDVVENADGYHFYFEMPGVKADSAELRVEEGRLIVEAERTRPEYPKEASVHVAERTFGKIRRAFKLPEDATSDGITASYKDGVLEVTVLKKPESKPLKIKVNYQN
ncbi:MAG TPA: Hsp20/alpha crystallin family protein [Candidatus Binataceae bacterium]|nr:Hsp20/alpha crystallin family protein [Candidatus Binataceae bacterium]